MAVVDPSGSGDLDLTIEGAADMDGASSAGRALLVVEAFEPFEQSLFDALRSEGADPIVYHMTDQEFWIPGESIALKPLFQDSVETSFLHRREIEQVCQRFGITHSVCVGLRNAHAFAKVSPVSIVDHAVMAHGDFDFSSNRHPRRSQAARDLARYFDRVFFVDEHQFTAACDKGSQSRHFTIDIPFADTGPEQGPLDENGDVIALVHTPSVDDEEWLAVAAQLTKDFPGKRVRAWQESDLIESLECNVDTTLADAMRQAFHGVSNVVYMGISRNSRSVLRVLANNTPQRVAVQDHIAYRLCPWDMHRTFGLCAGSELPTRLKRKDAEGTPPPSTAVTEQLRLAMQSDLPPFYEDFRALDDGAPLSVFFSVTPVQAGAMGARVQRIRNMFRAFQRRGANPIPISSSPLVLERRLKLVDHLIGQGRKFDFLYGENSTAPMSRYRSVVLLERLMRSIRAQGGRLAWFIRDLHFMDSDVWKADGKDDLVDRLHLEYAAVGRHVDIFYAPTEASVESFRAHLPKQERTEVSWKSLPPGMPELTRSPADPSGDAKVTFVYSGGLGPVYKMDRYLKAVAAFRDHQDVQFDFVVRPAEQHVLENSAISLASSNVKIVNDPFSEYRSTSRHVVGVVLLDSAYANAGFPLKVAHYAARRVPILHFADAAFASFVADMGIGFSTPPTDQAVFDTIKSIMMKAKKGELGIPDSNFECAFAQNSWDSRADQVMADLGVRERGKAEGLINRIGALVRPK